eukprot:5226438-Pleurochrysis_carterae.AAC.7
MSRGGAGVRRKRSFATALKEAEEGARGDGPSECASRRASAMAARPPEGPGCIHLDGTGEREQVKVESPVLGRER